VGVIVDLLKEELKKPVYAMLVLPFENQYDEPDSVINTATCLKKVLDNSKADAVFLVDNQKFVRKNESVGFNFSMINRRIADSFMDILCVGEETDRRFIGEVLDANDVIRILHGPTAIGVSHTQVPPPRKSGLLDRFVNSGSEPRHFSVSKAQIERAQTVVNQALAELSVDCEYTEDNKVMYDAQGVLGLFSGPPQEATEEIVQMMDSTFAERVPGAGRRKGTYPGRASDTISVTVVVSNLGEGSALRKVEWFYREATRMVGDTRDKIRSREDRWEEASRLADLLPNL
jgi:cell division GTPase FtsZ